MQRAFLETIRVVDGAVLHLAYHQERYESVLHLLNSKNIQNLKDLIDPPKDGLYRCRVVYDAKDISVEFFEYKKRQVKSLKLICSNEIEYANKSTNREDLDGLFAKRGSCDDVLIVKNSLISDTTIANVALLRDGLWYSPKTPLLEGTTRARLLKEKKILLRDIKVDDINEYSGLALMNAMIDFDIITRDNLKDIIC